MGRSVRNTRGISDSRDRALGDVKNELEHSKGDLRKSLSHPHSLTVLEAQPAALARHSPRDWQKTTPMCKFLPRLADFQLCSRPGLWELCTKGGWQEEPSWLLIQTQHTGKCWLQPAEREDAVVPC